MPGWSSPSAPSNTVTTPGAPTVVLGPQESPTDHLCTYFVLDNNLVPRGITLDDVVKDPKFTSVINQGAGTCVLELEHYPAELNFGDIIEIRMPTRFVAQGGQPFGRWIYEQRNVRKSSPNQYEITLLPLAVELTGADYSANWSNDPSPPQAHPPLGPVGFATPVQQALALTKHCSGIIITDNGTPYDYTFTNANAQQTLQQAVTFGGSFWWWHCDSMGGVLLCNTGDPSGASGTYTAPGPPSMVRTGPQQHMITLGRDDTETDWQEDTIGLFNGQLINGGSPVDASGNATQFPLWCFVQDTGPNIEMWWGDGTINQDLGAAVAKGFHDPAVFASPNGGQYSTASFGRRTNTPYSDSSLVSLSSVQAVAQSALLAAERISARKTVSIKGYTISRPQPGDSVMLLRPSPDPAGPVSQGYVPEGPFLVLETTTYGATDTYDLVLAADMCASNGPATPSNVQAINNATQGIPGLTGAPGAAGIGGIPGTGVGGVAGCCGSVVFEDEDAQTLSLTGDQTPMTIDVPIDVPNARLFVDLRYAMSMPSGHALVTLTLQGVVARSEPVDGGPQTSHGTLAIPPLAPLGQQTYTVTLSITNTSGVSYNFSYQCLFWLVTSG